MSACEFLTKHKNAALTNDGRKQEEEEVRWGTAYRYKKRKEREKRTITPVGSPLNIPYKLCLIEQKEKENERKKQCKCAKKHSESPPPKKYTLLQLNTISQQKYMDYLSQPMQRSPPKVIFHPPSPKKFCQQFEFCSPRLEQLATPKKRNIFHTWLSYQGVLPVEAQLRFQKLLHTTQNIDPKTARCYFKRVDREKQKKRREKLRLKRKKELEKKRGNKRWQTQQIDKVADRIVEFFKKEPLFTLTYKQLLLSDSILTDVERKKLHKKPPRQTKDPYKLGIVEIADKLAVWIDMVTQFVDVQAVDSEQDIPSIVLSTIEMEGEEEEEEEESEYSSEEEESEGKEASIWGDEEGVGGWGEGGVEEEEKDGHEGGGFEEEEGIGGFEEEEGKSGVEEMETEGEAQEEHTGPEGEEEVKGGMGGEEEGEGVKAGEEEGEGIKSGEEKGEGVKTGEEEGEADKTVEQEGDKLGDKGGEEGKGEEVAVEAEAEPEVEAAGEKQPAVPQEEENPIVGEEEEMEGMVFGQGAGEENKGVPRPAPKEEPEAESEMEAEEGAESVRPEEEGEMEGTEAEISEAEGEEAAEGAPEGKPTETTEKKPVKEVKPLVPVEEHYPKLLCCLSLKTWAYWLLYITSNAHEWTSWIADIIQQVRHFAKVLRGESRLPNGNIEIMNRNEWIKFVEETERKAKNWQKYSEQVKELTGQIIEKYHNKKVKCCPKCVQENLIKNVTTAQETLLSLTDAMNNAGCWQKQLDVLIQATYKLTCNWAKPARNVAPDESVGFEIEELDVSAYSTPHCSTFCPGRYKPY